MKKLTDKKYYRKLSAWLTVIRFQFYPMAWIAYSFGALLFVKTAGGDLKQNIYWTGYSILFIIELITILFNEYFDFDTDSKNKNYSMFTGGTRMLVEGRLSFREIKAAIVLLLIISAFLIYKLYLFKVLTLTSLLLISVLLFLGIGYTTPPFKFCYRGLGELVVCLTHSPIVIMCGFVLQGGSISDPLPWLYSVPLFLATFSAIVLAGIPDRLSDSALSKKTFAVLLGPRRAAFLAFAGVIAAAISGILLLYYRLINGLPGILFLFIIPHAVFLWISIYRIIKTNYYDRQINFIMQLALSYIIWFGIIPLIYMFL